MNQNQVNVSPVIWGAVLSMDDQTDIDLDHERRGVEPTCNKCHGNGSYWQPNDRPELPDVYTTCECEESRWTGIGT